MKKKEKKYELLKGVLLLLIVAIVLSWLIPNGTFSASGFTTDNALSRVGINDLAWLIYYAIYFSIDKIIFLLALGGLYGILNKTSVYEKMVTSLAKKVKNKNLFVILTSVIIAIFTSVLTSQFIILLFIPFIIAIMNRLKLDKLTILLTTFGSILVGTMGATLGTEGLFYFNRYVASDTIGVTTTMPLLIRIAILVIGLVLFNFFTLNNMRKNKDNETSDMFITDEETLDKKGASALPIIIVGCFLFLLSFMAYFNWNGIGVTAFDDLHTAITDIHIGESFYIFKDLLGSNMTAFGTWDLFSMTSIVFLMTIVISLCYKIKFNDFIHDYVNGAKKLLKPICCIVGAYMLMVVVYMSPYIATIANKLLSMTAGFNIVTMFITSLLCNIFHTDLGYSAYVLSSYLTSEYADSMNLIYVMYITLYGFVQFFIPTSFLLGIGLTSLDVKYRDYLKHIWKFILGMFICLFIIFILMMVL